jgi:hypothetical protein
MFVSKEPFNRLILAQRAEQKPSGAGTALSLYRVRYCRTTEESNRSRGFDSRSSFLRSARMDSGVVADSRL